MVDVSKVMEEKLIPLANDFILKHNQLGMKATGDWEDSIEIQSDLTGARILANDYTEFLTKGREPGKRPPVSQLEKWVNAKLGITGKQGLSVSFAIANKIAKEGTTWYQQGGSDLVDGVLTPDRQTQILREVAQEVTIQITDALRRSIKQLAA